MTSKTPKEKCTCQYEKNNGHSFECPLYEARPFGRYSNLGGIMKYIKELKENSWEEEWEEWRTKNAGKYHAQDIADFFFSLLAKQKEGYEVRINALEHPIPSRMAELIENIKKHTKDKIIEMVEKLDDTGGGSGRRLKLQLLDKIKTL